MQTLATLSFVLIVITTMTILIFRDWRINAIAFIVVHADFRHASDIRRVIDSALVAAVSRT